MIDEPTKGPLAKDDEVPVTGFAKILNDANAKVKRRPVVVPEWIGTTNLHRLRGWAAASGISFEEALRLREAEQREAAAKAEAAKVVPWVQPREESAGEAQSDAEADTDKASGAGFTFVEEEDEEQEERHAPVGVLDPKAPFDNAKKYVTMDYWNVGAKSRMLHHWQGQYWEWDGMHWRVLDHDTVKSKLYHFLNAAEKEPKPNWKVRFQPARDDVNKLVDALDAEVNLPPGVEMPGWFGKPPPGVENLKELVACQNGLLHLPTRRLIPHTPRRFSIPRPQLP
jgi:hypothetical protein